jgi:hypothetical protein
MTELEKYIRDNAAAFDTESPAEGHEARFLARVDEASAEPAVRERRGGRSRNWFFGKLVRKIIPGRPLGAGRSRETAAPRNAFARQAWVPALALACALLLILVIRPGDPFRGVSNEPEAIYLAYMDRVADLYQALPLEDGTLQEITEEADPLFAQLPDNISSRQRGRILKNHYGELLAAARQLKNNQ